MNTLKLFTSNANCSTTINIFETYDELDDSLDLSKWFRHFLPLSKDSRNILHDKIINIHVMLINIYMLIKKYVN